MRRLAAGDVVLVGDLAQIPPTDLLNFLHQGRQSGVLYARSEGVERALVLDDGNVSWGVSSRPAERFGEILTRHGMLDREELARALKAQAGAASTGRIGEVLIERGAFAREDLPRALRVQVVEIFLALLVVRRGEFLLFGGFDRAMLPVSAGVEYQGPLPPRPRRVGQKERVPARPPRPPAPPHPEGTPLDPPHTQNSYAV